MKINIKFAVLIVSMSLVNGACMSNDARIEDRIIGEWKGTIDYVEDYPDSSIVEGERLVELDFINTTNGYVKATPFSHFKRFEYSFEWELNEIEQILTINSGQTLIDGCWFFGDFNIVTNSDHVLIIKNEYISGCPSNDDFQDVNRREIWNLEKVK